MQGYRAIYGLKLGEPTPPFAAWLPDSTGNKKFNQWRTPKHSHPWWNITLKRLLVRNGLKSGSVTKPKEYGGHAHPFMQHVASDAAHRARLDDKQMQTLATWFDNQIPYVDHYHASIKKKLVPMHVEAYPPFGKNRIHTILTAE